MARISKNSGAILNNDLFMKCAFKGIFAEENDKITEIFFIIPTTPRLFSNLPSGLSGTPFQDFQDIRIQHREK
jgi:hypothetical protein